MVAKSKEETRLRELKEHNVALQTQVKSLKHMIKQLQRGSFANRSKIQVTIDSKDGGKLEVKSSSNQQDLVSEQDDKTNSSSNYTKSNASLTLRGDCDCHWRTRYRMKAKEHEKAQEDIQQLLEKVRTKQAEIDQLHRECSSWEEQVMQLKFEVQSVKYDAKEQEEEFKAFQHQSAAQEATNRSSFSDPLSSMMIDKLFPSSPRDTAYSHDLKYYKSLALIRANYWKAAEDKVEQLRLELGNNRKEKESALKCADIAQTQMEQMKKDLDTLVQAYEFILEQSTQAEAKSRRIEEEFHQLHSELKCLKKIEEEFPILRKIDKQRSARIIQDLRFELNQQLMVVEKLQEASLLFSPRNSRGLDPYRKKLILF